VKRERERERKEEIDRNLKRKKEAIQRTREEVSECVRE